MTRGNFAINIAGAERVAKTGLEIRRRAAQVNGRARVAEWQTRQT